MNRHLNGGCQVPIAGYAEIDGDRIHFRALVGDPTGATMLRAQADGSAELAEQIGVQVAEDLLAQGAGPILAAINEPGKD